MIPIADDIKGIKTGVDKTAAELAIPRLEKEITEISHKIITMRQNLINKYVDDGIMKFSVANLIENIEKRKYGTKFGFFTNSNTIYVDRLSAITIEDIDYLTQKAIYDMPDYYRKGCNEFLLDLKDLKSALLELESELAKKKDEIGRLKKLLTY